MIPFARILTYGNTVQNKFVKKIAGWQKALYLLDNNNILYAFGESSNGEFGNGQDINNFLDGWHILRDDVEDFWIEDMTPGCIIKTVDGKWFYTGWIASVIPNASNTNTFTDFTDLMLSDGNDIHKLFTTRHGLYKIDSSGVVKVISPTNYPSFGLSTAPLTWTMLQHTGGPIEEVLDVNGNIATWLLTKTGELYRCGNDNNSGIANNGVTLLSFTRLVLPNNQKCKSLSSDALSFKCITIDGNVYSWGTNYYSTATPGSTASPAPVQKPTLVTNTLSLPAKSSFTTFNVLTYIVDGYDRLMVNGYNNASSYSSGTGSTVATIVNYLPTIFGGGDVQVKGSEIKTITACGNYSTILCDVNGNVYGAGQGKYLPGLEATILYPKFTPIKLPWNT